MENLKKISSSQGVNTTIVVLILGLTAILLSSCLPEHPKPPLIPSNSVSDPLLRDILTRIEKFERLSEWYNKQGRNVNGKFVAVTLAVATALGIVITAIESTPLGRKKPRIKRIIILVLAIIVAINSGVGSYCRWASDQFYASNQQQYLNISDDLDTIITDFYFAYIKGGYNDDNIPQKRDEFISLAKDTFDRINNVLVSVAEDYPMLELMMPAIEP